jgi:hypothetical protein
VDSIRDSLPFHEGISIPEIIFNYKEKRLEAEAFISSDFEKAPLETIKTNIIVRYLIEYRRLKVAIPELSEDDFVLNVNRGSNFQPFAECSHGNIVFH